MRASLRQVLFRSAGLDLNFAGGVFSLNNTRTDSPANIPGWSFSRTDTNGTATALDLAGNVIQFATGVPRITNRGILVEEARTNLFPRSTEFDNAIWLKTGVTVTANQIAAPDASTTADAFTEDMGLSTHRVLYGSSSVTSGTSYTLSAFVKASGRTWCALNFATGFTNERASFNLANGTLGTVTGGTATITALANSWYRVTLTATCILTTAAGATYLEWASADNTVIYTGSGALAGYWWGAQLEAGAFATSPIITTGAAGTRGADTADQTLLTIPVATFFQGSVNNLAANMRPWEMHGGSDAERVFIQVTSGGALNAFVVTGSVAVVTISTPAATITAGTTFKALLRRNDAGTWRLFINGVAVGSESAVAALPSVTTLGIGRRRTNVEYLNGFAARLRLFPTPPSDADSLAMTAP